MDTIKTVLCYLLFTVMVTAIGVKYFGISPLLPTVNPLVTELPLPVKNSLYDHREMYGDIDTDSLRCIAKNIYHEARNQGDDGMFSVGFVTLNRMYHADYPSDACEVVYEPYQFSWVLDNPNVNKNNTVEYRAWLQSLQIAESILRNPYQNDMYGVTHYHTDAISPDWSASKTVFIQIKDHVFYVDV